jgi:hypothetical protein
METATEARYPRRNRQGLGAWYVANAAIKDNEGADSRLSCEDGAGQHLQRRQDQDHTNQRDHPTLRGRKQAGGQGASFVSGASLTGGQPTVLGTRPDIAQAVGALSRYMQHPTEHHWNTDKNVLRYLSGAPEVGIVFKQKGGSLVGCCDASYADDLDIRRSTTGYVFLLGGGAVSWARQARFSQQLPCLLLKLSTWQRPARPRRRCGCTS